MFKTTLCAVSVVALAGTAAANPIELRAEVLWTSPQELAFTGLDLFPEGTGYTRGGVYAGQPRISNDGDWYILYQGFTSPNPPAIEFVRNYFVLRNGDAFIREGLPISSSELAAPVADFAFSQQPFFDVSISGNGSVAQIFDGRDQYGTLADGTPNPGDLDFGGDRFALRFLAVDREVIIQQGETISLFDGFGQPDVVREIEEIAAVEIGANGDLLVRSTIGETATFEPSERAIFRINDPTVTATQELIVSTFDDDSLAGLGLGANTFGSGEAAMALNDSGDFITTVDIRGAGALEDDAVVLWDDSEEEFVLLARAGQPSPIAGRNWNILINTPVALTNDGDYAFTATLTGNSSTGDVVVVNGQIVSSEGDTLNTATGPRNNNFSDSINDQLLLDSDTNVYFYSQWNAMVADTCPGSTPDEFDTSFAIWEGILRNDQPFIEAGRTIIRDVAFSDGQFFPELVVADVPNNPFSGFSISPDGSTFIGQALAAVPTGDPCDAAPNNDATALGQVVFSVDLDRYNGCVGADRNADFEFTAFDLTAFASSVDAGDVESDLDQDGSVDFVDVLNYAATAEDCITP